MNDSESVINFNTKKSLGSIIVSMQKQSIELLFPLLIQK